jgi:hypothetical protein
MNKLEVQARILQNGKPLDLDKFSWDETTNIFSSAENYLVLDFNEISNCTFKTGSNCTFNTSWNCTFKTGSNCTFNTGSDCTFKTGGSCTFNTDWNCTFNTGGDSSFNTGSGCTFKTSWNCTFKTSGDCSFNTGSYCTFNTGNNCTFDTDCDCSFNTGRYCTFNTGGYCTFNTGNNCTFNIYEFGHFINKEINNVVIVRNSNKKTIYDLDILPKDKFLKLTLDNVIEKEIKDVEMIDDSIMVRLSSDKTVKGCNVFKAQYIVNYFENDDITYIAQKDNYNAHGSTIKQAIEDVEYKILSDKLKKEPIKLTDIMTMEKYHIITGSCIEGIKQWCNENNIDCNSEMIVKDLLPILKKTNAYKYEVILRLLEEN